MENYFIKEGYRINKIGKNKAISYVDKMECAQNFQVEVYKFAYSVFLKHKLKNVLDIGCGIGLKLKDFTDYSGSWNIDATEITGIDGSKANIQKCRELGFGEWYIDDVENSKIDLNKKFDLIISADVIEHLFDPDSLLVYIRKFCHKHTLVIISTPERDLTKGANSYGPPHGHHIREWNKYEFNKYIESRDFVILDHFLTEAKRLRGLRPLISKSKLDGIMWLLRLIKGRYKSCQVVLCKCNLSDDKSLFAIAKT